MNVDALETWANELSQPEAQLMLLHAAKEHTIKFTTPDLIGMDWAKILRERGYNALCPYARNYLAHRYLTYCEDSHARTRSSAD